MAALTGSGVPEFELLPRRATHTASVGSSGEAGSQEEESEGLAIDLEMAGERAGTDAMADDVADDVVDDVADDVESGVSDVSMGISLVAQGILIEFEAAFHEVHAWGHCSAL